MENVGKKQVAIYRRNWKIVWENKVYRLKRMRKVGYIIVYGTYDKICNSHLWKNANTRLLIIHGEYGTQVYLCNHGTQQSSKENTLL